MKQLCGFAVSHIVTHYYAASHRVAWSVGLSVALSVCHTKPCKNGWNDQVAICVLDSGGPNEPCITWGPDANMGRNNLRRKQANQYRDTLRSSMQTRLNRSRCRLGCGLAWAQSITCYMRGPDNPWERAILVDRDAHCKAWALSTIGCAITAEPICLPFRLWTGVGRRMHKFNRIRHGRTRCRHLSNNIEPSVYGSDAPYGKLLW